MNVQRAGTTIVHNCIRRILLDTLVGDRVPLELKITTTWPLHEKDEKDAIKISSIEIAKTTVAEITTNCVQYSCSVKLRDCTQLSELGHPPFTLEGRKSLDCLG